jgi:hypothetical protein
VRKRRGDALLLILVLLLSGLLTLSRELRGVDVTVLVVGLVVGAVVELGVVDLLAACLSAGGGERGKGESRGKRGR